MFIKVLLSLSFFFILLSADSVGKGTILMKSVFEERVVWDNIRGNVRKMLPATKVERGSVLVYVNQVTNNSTEIKEQIVVDNPVPFGTTYLRGTSSCEGVCEMLYSIDGGTTFKKSEELFVLYGTKKRAPKASEYTHIKFIFTNLAAHSKVRMAFKARVE